MCIWNETHNSNSLQLKIFQKSLDQGILIQLQAPYNGHDNWKQEPK